MELDDIKQKWNMFSEHIEKQGILNRKLILDMISTRTQNSLTRLINYHLFSLAIIVALAIFLYFIDEYKKIPSHIMIISYIGISLSFIFQVLIILNVLTIKTENINVIKSEKKLNNYWKFIIVGHALLWPWLLIFLATFLYYLWSNFSNKTIGVATIFIVVMLLFSLVASMIEYRFIKTKIKFLKKNFKQLKEFDMEID